MNVILHGGIYNGETFTDVGGTDEIVGIQVESAAGIAAYGATERTDAEGRRIFEPVPVGSLKGDP